MNLFALGFREITSLFPENNSSFDFSFFWAESFYSDNANNKFWKQKILFWHMLQNEQKRFEIIVLCITMRILVVAWKGYRITSF